MGSEMCIRDSADVAALVIAGAERVIEDNIDASKHDTMLTKLASEL